MKLKFEKGQIIVLDSKTTDFTDDVTEPKIKPKSLSERDRIKKRDKALKKSWSYKRDKRRESVILTATPITVSKKAYLKMPELLPQGAKCVADVGYRHYISYGSDPLEAVNRAWAKMRGFGFKVRLPEGFMYDLPYPKNTKVVIDN